MKNSFEQILQEEFLVNTQDYPKEYHELSLRKFRRAKLNYEAQPSPPSADKEGE